MYLNTRCISTYYLKLHIPLKYIKNLNSFILLFACNMFKVRDLRDRQRRSSGNVFHPNPMNLGRSVVSVFNVFTGECVYRLFAANPHNFIQRVIPVGVDCPTERDTKRLFLATMHKLDIKATRSYDRRAATEKLLGNYSKTLNSQELLLLLLAMSIEIIDDSIEMSNDRFRVLIYNLMQQKYRRILHSIYMMILV
jgi:hypothetical protein